MTPDDRAAALAWALAVPDQSGATTTPHGAPRTGPTPAPAPPARAASSTAGPLSADHARGVVLSADPAADRAAHARLTARVQAARRLLGADRYADVLSGRARFTPAEVEQLAALHARIDASG